MAELIKNGNRLVVDGISADTLEALVAETTFTTKEYKYKRLLVIDGIRKDAVGPVRQLRKLLGSGACEVSAYEHGKRLTIDLTGIKAGGDIDRTVKRIVRDISKTSSGYRQHGVMEFKDRRCSELDHKKRFATSWGFRERIQDKLSELGHDRPTLRDVSPSKDPRIFVPQWDNVYRFIAENPTMNFRPGQEEALMTIACYENGRFDLPTAFGKSFLLGFICLLYPLARIDIATMRAGVLHNAIYPEICSMLPGVGICCGSKKVLGQRVMCWSVKSLHRSNFDADILLVDEEHETAADDASSRLAHYLYSRNYGFSATPDKRLDDKDFRCEALYGPIRMRRTYQEAVADGNIAQVEVYVTDVRMPKNPCEGARNSVERKRLGIWRNDYRNQLIATDARQYGEEIQTLITVETLDHAVRLKKLLPEYELVYAPKGLKHDRRRQYENDGLLDSDEPHMDFKRWQMLTTLFERGKLRKAICTGTWNVGVDFTELSALCRGDAGGSPIMDSQIPGRTARLDENNPDKVGRIHDYDDHWDDGFHRKSGGRVKSYKESGWKVFKATALAEQMEFNF